MVGQPASIGSVHRGHRVGLELYDGQRHTGMVRQVRERRHLLLRCRRVTILLPLEVIRRVVRL